jgi:hypothetical protein
MFKSTPQTPMDIPKSKNMDKLLSMEVKESPTIMSLINRLSGVKYIQSSDGKDINTADIVVLLEDLMSTNKIADLQNKMEQYEKYITRNYGLRDKVKALVANRISKIDTSLNIK